jgi:hypothetical protein
VRGAYIVFLNPFIYPGWVGDRVGNKKPTKKTHPKKQKKHLFKFLIFYENNTNFSL